MLLPWRWQGPLFDLLINDRIHPTRSIPARRSAARWVWVRFLYELRHSYRWQITTLFQLFLIKVLKPNISKLHYCKPTIARTIRVLVTLEKPILASYSIPLYSFSLLKIFSDELILFLAFINQQNCSIFVVSKYINDTLYSEQWNGDSTDQSNFSSIVITSLLCKVMERFTISWLLRGKPA